MKRLPRATSPTRVAWPSLLRSRLCFLSLVTICSIVSLWELSSLQRAANWSKLLQRPFKAWQTAQYSDPYRANSTLGFQAVIAISGENTTDLGAWRQSGLRAAAKRTGLQIQIFEQSEVTAQELIRFRGNGEWRPEEASALAWMGHLELLQYIVDNQISTALILEDDADWDIKIREQMAPAGDIASAFRRLYQAPDDEYLSRPFSEDFDVLWLGHCGASITEGSRLMTVPDDTLLPAAEMRSIWGLPYVDLGNNVREVFTRSHATCTYAYAVTLEGARNVIRQTTQGGDAFDNTVARNCAERQLDCSSLGPELFHQMRRVQDGSLIDAIRGALHGEKVEHHQGEENRYFTHNIKYSARCNAGHSDEDLVQCLPTPEEFDQILS